MPKRHNIRKTNGGADITKINALHDQLVDAAQQALNNEIQAGDIKPSTLNAIRQLCADAGVTPSREHTDELSALSSLLPKIDVEGYAKAMRR